MANALRRLDFFERKFSSIYSSIFVNFFAINEKNYKEWKEKLFKKNLLILFHSLNFWRKEIDGN